MTAHWGIPDLAAVRGSEVERAFRGAFFILDRRISLFLCLPLKTLDSLALVNVAFYFQRYYFPNPQLAENPAGSDKLTRSRVERSRVAPLCICLFGAQTTRKLDEN